MIGDQRERSQRSFQNAGAPERTQFTGLLSQLSLYFAMAEATSSVSLCPPVATAAIPEGM